MSTQTITITPPDGMEFDRIEGDRIVWRKKRWRANPGGEYWTISRCGLVICVRDNRYLGDDQNHANGWYWQTEAEAQRALNAALSANAEPVADKTWFPKYGETYWSRRGYGDYSIYKHENCIESITRQQAERFGVYPTEAEAIAKCKPADTPPARQDVEATPEPVASEPEWTPKDGDSVWLTRTLTGFPASPWPIHWSRPYGPRRPYVHRTRALARAAWKIDPENPANKKDSAS